MKERENKVKSAAVQPISVTVTRRLHESVWRDNTACAHVRSIVGCRCNPRASSALRSYRHLKSYINDAFLLIHVTAAAGESSKIYKVGHSTRSGSRINDRVVDTFCSSGKIGVSFCRGSMPSRLVLSERERVQSPSAATDC